MKHLSTKTEQRIITTHAALKDEYQRNGWAARLLLCIPVRRDRETSKPPIGFKTQKQISYFEDGIHIAHIFHYERNDGTTCVVPTMLKVNGVLHVAQSTRKMIDKSPLNSLIAVPGQAILYESLV
jgi:hypothetical protein